MVYFHTSHQAAPRVRAALAGAPNTAGRALSDMMPLIQCRILAQLATKAIDARGYTALQVAGYEVGAIDDAIEVLHHDGLLNAFFINREARPRFHPSSLTREGRRIHDQSLRITAA